MGSYSYYQVELKLITEMLGTNPSASIYDKHIMKKTKDLIKEANKLGKKAKKSLEKYVGAEIKENKEIEDLKSVLGRYQEAIGRNDELPNDHQALLDLATEYEEEFKKMTEEGKAKACTGFMRRDGKVCISSHMILGNIRENLRLIFRGTDAQADKSRDITSGKFPYENLKEIKEATVVALKVVEPYIYPDQDILRDAEGKPVLNERVVIDRDAFGKSPTSIASSEQLPEGTKFKFVIRIPKGNVLDNADLLGEMFSWGKNNGLGQWRGSGGKGAFKYKLTALPDYVEKEDEEGFL